MGIVFHLPGSALRDPDTMKPFYTKLIAGFRAQDLQVTTVVHDRATVAARVAADDDFHIIDHGGLRHPRALNAGIAYVYPFWHLDPWGIRAQSSVGAAVFDQGEVHGDQAADFVARLRRRWVAARQSRYEQPRPVRAYPGGCIAVFLQAEGHRMLGETCHLTPRDMVKALIARDDPRPIIVKPHPMDDDAEMVKFLRKMAKRDARLRLSRGNIHDILAAADVAVTINSAVGIEALLHGRPVVLCGQADFHHICQTVTTAAGMGAGIDAALATSPPYAAYLHWYFGQNCLNAGAPTLVADALARITATGHVLRG